MARDPQPMSPEPAAAVARSRGRFGLPGLLAVVVVLAVALVVTALLSYQAARGAARSVLYSRAAEVGTSVRAAARLLEPDNREELQRLLEEVASAEASVTVVEVDGKVLASAGGPAPASVGQRIPTTRILGKLRVDGQVQRLVAAPEGERLELWQPVATRRGPGPRHRGWGRWLRKGFGPAPFGPPPPELGRRLKLLRVVVAGEVADPVVQPARLTLAVSSTAAALLLVLALLMFRAARRARRIEQELQRRRALVALGEMGAVLAHEIRTPLGSIKGNAQLIGEAHPADERVDAVVREAGRLERLVNGLLDYARPAEPRRQSCDPDQVAGRAAQIVAAKAEAAGVSLIVDPADCGACLQADPDQLLQVLVNLLQNAVEASADPRATASHVALRVRRARGRVSFAVLDSGPGLGAAALDQLMQPFYSTKPQGTGLGLSVARQIVEQHGGELNLSSRREGGVVAEASLPEKGGPLS